MLQLSVPAITASHAVVHPGTTAFLGAGIQIEIEAAAQFAIRVDNVIETHVRMPGFNGQMRLNTHTEQALHHLE